MLGHAGRWMGRLAALVVMSLAMGSSGCLDGNSGVSSSGSGGGGGAPGTIRIQPSGASLEDGETSVVLKAVDADGSVNWSVDDTTLGSLSTSNGLQVVYNRSSGTSEGVNVVRATDSAQNRATSNIVHSSVDPGGFTVTPSETDIGPLLPAAAFTLTAEGGTPPYSWSVSNSGLGTVTPFGSPDRELGRYESTSTGGTNRVTVRDSEGRSAVALVNQVAP